MNRDIQLLIVDDNAATRYALRRRLESHDYHVLEAGTGQEGLDLIAREKIDGLILDVNLPDMSGFDIVRVLRADPVTALLPVVHVSAASIETGDIITGLDAGADAYLIHPVDPDVLLATLRTLLRVRDTEYALRESEARFREIFFNISAPIAVMDAQLKVHECNHAFAQLIHDNLNPDALLECFAADQLTVLQELCQRLAAGERWKGTLQMKVDGQLRETEWQISPYRRAELSLVFVEDVTEHRHRERHQQAELANATTQLARTEAQLLQAQKMDALGKLTGGIAHDFNNLLTGIITSLELIKKRIDSQRTDKVMGYADAALSSALSAAGLTNRLLAFARQQPLDTRPIDINAHIRSLEELLVRTIGEHIALKLELTNNPAVAMVDPIQLESAVLNLVINARDALPKGGNIWVTTYPAYSNGNLKLENGPYIALSVRDNGVGIEHSVIDKVFDPFFTTKPLGQGTGLGLSTIYGFARQSGGDALIRSVTRQGTEVTIMLPAASGPASTATKPVAAPGQSSGEHVLIVEDMPSVRSFVAEVLVDAGYRCSLAADGDEAVTSLRNDPSIDLLLTDVGLPYMNGRELADIAREMHPALPILFMTGYAENAANRQSFLGEGMDLISKPFHIDELLEKIRRGLDGAAGAG
ncbi:hybrid sensor histidine kinase/response regulator [Pseudomonas aylmerensis]|uniref:histidine kinase n=1 Tax=Pseudomonas aylmerensis TaxID=1869229 RepID=A0A2T4FQY7_9PSED|nr:response regulator [Pseudomonas aylmerensis]AYF47467.1 hybrid sensor histidine kinase/response regulator [Pseudomonas fluorescens]OCW30413.1 hybrid sensor histidine kinase/response regulator [Pseudomonas aylmerensis]PTC25831.1 hybrid sensor histidine kinase/response regulator [Pseudomonas aylmerensis]QTV18463.1 response regulator [Pseudomonas fluorescens]